ncbi:response regulator [Nibrella viscosa]|uniref:Response regulator n=1 Tax=Nibrella viscosa TaxID=1084524 RepID=A0ABP8KQK0_9BACT
MNTSVAIVEDHNLFAQLISDLIQKFEGYEVSFVAEAGRPLFGYLQRNLIPDILLLDLHLPDMDGEEIAKTLKEKYPDVKILVLTHDAAEEQIVKLVSLGARGYLLKNCSIAELKQALNNVRTVGWHYSELLTSGLIRNLNRPDKINGHDMQLNDRETEFVKLACSDLRYKDIADKMCVAERTVDGYRESVFQKWNVKSRVGMAIEAIRRGIYKVK